MEEIKSCFMEEAFPLKEIIMNSTLPVTFKHTFVFSSYGGMIHFLNLSKNSIQYLPDKTLHIYLNTSLRHFVGFYDPVFQQIMSGHPTTLPRTLMKHQNLGEPCEGPILKLVNLPYGEPHK